MLKEQRIPLHLVKQEHWLWSEGKPCITTKEVGSGSPFLPWMREGNDGVSASIAPFRPLIMHLPRRHDGLRHVPQSDKLHSVGCLKTPADRIQEIN